MNSSTQKNKIWQPSASDILVFPTKYQSTRSVEKQLLKLQYIQNSLEASQTLTEYTIFLASA